LMAYLCGSIPFGYILVRLFHGKDIRETGSGNIGATNVARAAPALGIATLILDALKGYILLSILLKLGYEHDASVSLFERMIAIAALFVILGHLFPVWLKFRGGKGVATAVGVYLALAPEALAVAFAAFIVVFLISRYVSLASISATVVFPIAAYVLMRKALPHSVLLSMLLISVLIIAKHHSNIRRLLAGAEDRFGSKKATAWDGAQHRPGTQKHAPRHSLGA
jgi:glycerol-3-phosphate acyltransferase PlsY